MKYLKLFENISDVISEIESLKYILEDEGFGFDILDKKQYIQKLVRTLPVSTQSIGLITREKNSIKDGTHLLWVKSESNKELEKFFKSDEYEEFYERVEEICEKYNYYLKPNIGYSLKIEPKNETS